MLDEVVAFDVLEDDPDAIPESAAIEEVLLLEQDTTLALGLIRGSLNT